MPGTVPIDRDVLTSLRSGDELALERLFRASYPALADRARAELDDPSAAPRVVESAFLRAWAERTQFESPESLERFLQRSVHEGAVREKSRKAALHRFEQHERVHVGDHVVADARSAAAVPVEDAWAHVSAALHAPPVDAARAASLRHSHSRHEAAEHMASIAKRPAWMGPAIIAAVLALGTVAGMRWMDRTSGEVRVAQALGAPEPRVRATRSGERASLELLDGSRAVLGGDARLRIPKSFGDGLRAVALDGAASFTVRADAAAPFHVQTPQAMLTATGTQFDVRAYPGDGRTLVRVREGTVQVRAGERTRALAAGAALDVRQDGSMRELPAAALAEGFAWADGRLRLADRPLREALVEVQRWFGLTLQVPDASLLDRRVTADVELGATRSLLAALERSARVRFDYEGRTMVLRDAAAPASVAAVAPAP